MAMLLQIYTVDPRFGTLEEYKLLAKTAREKGIKLIMDHSQSLWFKPLVDERSPFSDWVNYQKRYEQNKPIITSNHRRTTNQDQYASKYDKTLMNQGWFVPQMPI